MLRRALVDSTLPCIQALPWAIWQLTDLPGVDGKRSPHFIVFGRKPIGLGKMPCLNAPRASASAEEWYEKQRQGLVNKLPHDGNKFTPLEKFIRGAGTFSNVEQKSDCR